MKSHQRGADLPDSVATKLLAIRRRATTVTLLEGLVLTGAVLIGAMLVAMLIDRAVGWFDPWARYTITILALVTAAAAFVLWCVRPLARKRTLVSTAREVDSTLPQLEERWSTVTEFAQTHDAPEVRGSEVMIQKVASEAEWANAAVTPQTIVPARPVFRASRWLAGATAVLALLFAVNFSETNRLLQRFWMPGNNISVTQVSASPADVWVPKGEPLTLAANVKGRVPKSAPQLFMRTPQGEKTSTMAAKRSVEPQAKTEPSVAPEDQQRGDATAPYLHVINEVSTTFDYRVRAGDGQTPWHRITAMERPRISDVKLKVTPPAYSQLPMEEKTALPNAIRVLEGSEVEVSFRSDQALERMLLDFGNGQSTQLIPDKDNWYRFRSRPTNSFTFAAAAISKFKLENKNKPSCRISVYEDLPPSVKILEPSDDIAVLPGEKVDVTFEAVDDLGLAKAEVIVSTTKADGETNGFTLSVALEADAGKKQFRKTVQLDPKALGLKHGDQLSYVVQVTDTKQAPASVSSAEATARGQQQPSQQLASAADSKADEQNRPEAQSDQDKPLAAAANNEEKEAQSSDRNSQNARQSSNQSSQLAKASSQKPSEPKQNSASQPPPNDMAMRMLDAGQSSECKPRNITVDEWKGAHDGEKRKKLEIAIDPVLKQLEELLAKAQAKTDSLKKPAALTAGLQPPHAAPLNESKGHLAESQRAIADLKARTSGTPYAFVGLQHHNLGEAHIVPAGKSLVAVSIPAVSASDNIARIDKASFHIGRAREMLADLTRTYETVRRDQQIADAMQRLNKMYQIFLEDTQALLGSSKGPINSYDRKTAEVDEEFVNKLKELLEEKKKIMAELAKLLSEDPRMLRRYMAMLELQSTTYRDQMTLLAERQQTIQQQVALWNTTPETGRAALLPQFQESYASQRRQSVQDAAKFRENLETWLPLDVKTEDAQVQTALTQAERVLQLMTEDMRRGNTNAGPQALAELRALRETLPHWNKINSTNQAKMTAHVANRLVDVESLITAQSGQLKMAESFHNGDFPKVAEIVQSRITQETVTLGEKLKATETQVKQLSQEIAEKAAQLNKITQTDIIPPQGTSLKQLAARDVHAAGESLDGIVPSFALAEQTFDELMRLIIAKLDQAPPPDGVGEAPGIEDLLALLEDEKRAAESLGIPLRPINVSLMTDWMKPGSNPGQGMGRAQGQAARAQAQQAKNATERLEKLARQSARKASSEAHNHGEAVTAGAGVTIRGEPWNKLVSKLQKDLLQGRDNTPPEQYRQAIENYFKIISTTTDEAPK